MSPGWVVGAGLALTTWGLALANPLVVLPGMLIATLSALAWLWSANVLSSVSCRLELDRTLARPGETVTGRLVIDNDQPVPVPWLDCIVEWPQAVRLTVGGHLRAHHRPGRAAAQHHLSLRWFERVTRPFAATCERRGEYVFGPVSLAVADPFGLYEGRKQSPGVVRRLVVIPRTVPVRMLRGPFARPFGERAKASWLWEDPAYLRGAREYQAGDPFSRLEWKATARTGRLHTRVADAALAKEVHVVLNVATGHALWQGLDDELLERTIVVAASLTGAAISAGCRVALHTNGLVRGSPGSAGLGAGAGPAHLAAALRLLGRLSPWPREPFGAVVARVIGAGGRGDVAGRTAEVWLVTPVWDQRLGALAAGVAAGGAAGTGAGATAVVLTGDERPLAPASARKPASGAEGQKVGGGGRRHLRFYAVAEGGAWDQLAQVTLSPLG